MLIAKDKQVYIEGVQGLRKEHPPRAIEKSARDDRREWTTLF